MPSPMTDTVQWQLQPDSETLYQAMSTAFRSELISPATAAGILGIDLKPRYMRIRMGVAELFEALKTGHILTLNSRIPRTARMRHVSYSEQSACFELLIEDDSFAPVPDLHRVPMIEGPAFGVFPLEFAAMKSLIENHAECSELRQHLPPEYADACHLARSGAADMEMLEERD